MNAVKIDEATFEDLGAGASKKSEPGCVLQVTAERSAEEPNACHRADFKDNSQNYIRLKDRDAAWSQLYRPWAF
jgi:hypothetical protein